MKTFEEYQYRFSIPHNKAKVRYKYTPKTIKELVKALEDEIELHGPNADLNCIDTSEITDMTCLFDPEEHEYAKNFNGNVSNWNVSNVEDMRFVFCGAENFNGDISSWDVSNAKNMEYMFWDAKSFNQDISKWDVGNVKDMNYMFSGAKIFNSDISGWNVANVEDMAFMFYETENFNQDLSNWDVSKVIYTNNIFAGCPIKEEYKPKFD